MEQMGAVTTGVHVGGCSSSRVCVWGWQEQQGQSEEHGGGVYHVE